MTDAPFTPEAPPPQLALDVERAEAAADEGMAQALRAERVAMWKQAANTWLDVRRQYVSHEFTADDLVSEVGLPDSGPARNNVVGAWVSAQARAGLIEFTGRFQKSQRVIGHGNLLRVWRVL